MEDTQIQIKISPDEKEIIRKASSQLTLGVSTYCRMVALEHARSMVEMGVPIQE